jgi:predicted enzyme related to lactoylglutathione lyase
MAKAKTKPKMKAVAPKVKPRTPAKGTPVAVKSAPVAIKSEKSAPVAVKPEKSAPVAVKPEKSAPVAVKPEKSAKIAKPSSGPVLRKLRSVIYTVGDLSKAKSFYSALLDRKPYFDQPFYVGFDIDGQELGLDPDTRNRKPGPGGAVGYWKVEDISASWEFAIANSAEPLEPPHAVGEGTSVAVVADPFGNYIGLIQIAN